MLDFIQLTIASHCQVAHHVSFHLLPCLTSRNGREKRLWMSSFSTGTGINIHSAALIVRSSNALFTAIYYLLSVLVLSLFNAFFCIYKMNADRPVDRPSTPRRQKASDSTRDDRIRAVALRDAGLSYEQISR
jgi:hypothetical protein